MIFDLFICPKCKEKLTQRGGSLYCLNNHCFDIAKEGYVNLMLANDKHSLNPEEISRDIIEKLHHTATLSTGTGMYSHEEKQILTCVVNKKQIVDMEKILKQYPETFAYIVPVNDTIGFFRRHG